MGEPIVEWLNQQQDNMVELLGTLSISTATASTRPALTVLGAADSLFDDNEIPHETIPLEEYGDAIRAVVSGGRKSAHSAMRPSRHRISNR